MIRLIHILLLLAAALSVSGKIRVEIRDSVTGGEVPYVAIFVEGTGRGILSDENGRADILTEAADPDTLRLRFSVMGYTGKTVSAAKTDSRLLVKLRPDGVQLRELTVKKKRSRYSKRNNPDVTFAERIRLGGDLTDPRKLHDSYNYSRYERITLGLNDFREPKGNGGRFSFTEEFVDTSEVSGKRVLIFSVKEKASDIHFRANPESEKEVVTGIRRAGLDDITDQESLQVFLEDVMREIDLYDNDIVLLQNRFVSPLSPIAPDFYKFFLTDTVDIDGERCVELSFTPRNRATFGFLGHVYVPQGDSTMFVKRVDMHLPPGINLNFIDRLFLRQDYSRAPDGSRLKTRDDMTAELSIVSGLQGFYTRRSTRYDSHNFDPAPDPSVFGYAGKVIVQPEAEARDHAYFTDGFAPATANEARIDEFVSRMRSVPLYYWSEKVMKVIFNGYISTSLKPDGSKFDIGPVNTLVSVNDVEGTRLRLGGMTTARLSPRWFFRGYGAYGTRDHRWKYSAEVEYSFHDKKYHSREFPVHSLRFTSSYDLDRIGQHYLATNADNFVLSFKRMKDSLMTYRRVNKLEYTLELENNFSILATLRHQRQEATPWIPFIDGTGRRASHYQETTAEITLRYAPGEKFYQAKSYRIPVNLDAPVIQLTHTFGPAGFPGNSFTINKTELGFQKRFWFSAFGYTDVILKGGHIWSRTPFPDLLIPNANLSYTIQPESYAMMNPMEFINDSYASWDITYWANGAILNYIPLIKKLKLREVFCFRGLTGELSSRNNPAMHPELYRFPADSHTADMHWKPYMEASVGLENIFKVLRLDYVWRLSYLDVPGIDRHGLRVAVHVTF